MFEAILTLIAIAVLANIVLMGIALAPTMRRRPAEDTSEVLDAEARPILPADTSPARPDPADIADRTRPGSAAAWHNGRRNGPNGTGEIAISTRARATAAAVRARLFPNGTVPSLIDPSVPPATFDRVVRVVAWVFLLSTTVIVAVSGLWRDNEPTILVLCALGGLFVLLVHDILPSDALGAAKFILEGSVAITFAALLVLLTGQAESPFFFTFPLIVGGAALVVSPRATVALAGTATIAYLVAVTVNQTQPFGPTATAIVGINLTAMLLLAYVGMVIAREQRRARDEALRLSTIDPLTSLHTRAYFFAALDREISRSARTGRRFCLLMMDLDELKTINDQHGHFHGDRVLRAIGEVIRQSVRRIDTAARYGGDEFVVLLPETDPTGAWVLAEKIRIGASDVALDADGSRLRTSISVGVVTHPDDGATPDALMIRADEAMYASKRAGKDRVMGVPTGPGRPRATADRDA